MGGYATNLFKEFFFEAVITVNLTSMLVLTTIFIDVSNNLPQTSYMKMIDVWLLFNLILPFLVVLIHTRMDTLRQDEDNKKEKKTMEVKKVDIKQEKNKQTTKQNSQKKLAFWQRVSLVYNPIIAF